jgi:protein-disulfide isomerase
MAKSNRRRDAERRAAAAQRQRQNRQVDAQVSRRRRSLLIAIVTVATIVVVVGVFLLVKTLGSKPTVSAGSVHGSTPHYGVFVGKPTAAATMVVYEDFQCPVCKAFENLRNSELMADVAKGTLRIEYRPIAILDSQSSTNYSTRSLNASACVLNATNATDWKKFHDLLYANQPAEHSSGLTDEQLAQYAAQAGASGDSVGQCIDNLSFGDWVASATNAASRANITATPTVQLGGQTLSSATLASDTKFAQAIAAAAKASGQ